MILEIIGYGMLSILILFLLFFPEINKYYKKINMRNKMKETYGRKPINFKNIILGTVIVILLFTSFYIVPAGHRGTMLTLGKPDLTEKVEGFGFKIPIIQNVIKTEVRTKKHTVLGDSSSKDLQDVQTEVALNYHVDPSFASELYQEIGKDYVDRIIDPAIQETLKSISAKYTAEELITKRTEVRNKLSQELSIRLEKSYLIVDDFNIVNFQFSEEFDKAIELKVTAEQLKLKAERDLERIKVEAKQAEETAIGIRNAKIADAEGEAKAIETINIQLSKSPEYIEWYKISKWNGILPQATSGMPFIDVTPKS